jgi:hypothetical protein
VANACPPPPTSSIGSNAQGFLANQVPWMLALAPQTLPPPFASPGDVFLHFILENFSSKVCTLVASGSPLFAPTPVHIMVRHGDKTQVALSSICQMLQFWLGSSFERISVLETSYNWF